MTEPICRTCLQIIVDPSDAYDLSSKDTNTDTLTLGGKLAECIPELMDISTLSLVLCWSCTTAVRCAYGFRQQCLETEERIKNFILQINGGILTDLRQVVDGVSEVNVLPIETNTEMVLEGEFVEMNESAIYNAHTECAQKVNKTVYQNNYLLEDTAEVMQPALIEGCEGYTTIDLIEDSNEINSEDVQFDRSISAPTRLKEGTEFNISAPSLLKKLLQDNLYVCQICNYKTHKSSKFQVHRRTHKSSIKEQHLII